MLEIHVSPKIALFIALAFVAVAQGCKLQVLAPAEDARDSVVYVDLDPPSPVHPSFGAKWMDYVRSDGSAACDGTSETGYSACLHGGELRRVAIPDVASCSGLSLSDALGVFEWACRVEGDVATFFSTGLREGKGLRDLVTASGWKSNSVSVTGPAVGSSPSTVWWSNPVAPLPDNSAATGALLNLDGTDSDGGTVGDGSDEPYAAGTILTLASSRATRGYTFNRDKLAIVTLPGAVLRYNGEAASNCNGGDQCMITGGARFWWLEGEFDGDATSGSDADFGIFFSGARFGRFHNATVKNTVNIGIRMYNASSNRITFVSVFNSGFNAGLTFEGTSDRNRVDRFQSLSGSYGLQLDGSYNVITRSSFSNHIGIGIMVGSTASRNVLQQVMAISNTQRGISVGGTGSHNIVSSATVGNSANWSNGVSVSGSSRNVLQNVVVANAGYGLGLSGSSANNTLVNIASAHNGSYAVNLATTSDNRFAGVLLVGTYGTPCTSDGTGTNPGLIASTCTDSGSDGSSAYSGQLSSAVLRTGRSLASTFSGEIAVDDEANSSDISGAVAAFPADPKSFDFGSFESWYRTWGIGGVSAFPSVSHHGAWRAGNAGQIWDWRLRASDGSLLRRTGDGASDNGAFVAGSACPDAVHGDRVVVDQDAVASNTFLVNAFEILDDGIGDNDGLCESSEACLYTPNFGAYQGHGALAECVFDDDGEAAAVDDVIMYGYAANGI